ncbi:MAG TPA: Txe/YoeB family addiction module toxin [Thermoanaerobaculia bacterium]|nr:Txe/YoeB family addiction module toxin [Thermoanaerobaculia bacterium]
MSRKPEPVLPPRREAIFEREFLEDLRFWIETDRKIALRALQIVESVLRDPFHGLGKPEPLKHRLAGAWSRRLTLEHRVVYVMNRERNVFLQARYHY